LTFIEKLKLLKEDSLKILDYARELERHYRNLKHSGPFKFSLEVAMAWDRVEESQKYLSDLKGSRFLTLSSLERRVSRDKPIELLFGEKTLKKNNSHLPDDLARDLFEKAQEVDITDKFLNKFKQFIIEYPSCNFKKEIAFHYFFKT
jgi:hypothetical protein